jgi:hypothetical protein
MRRRIDFVWSGLRGYWLPPLVTLLIALAIIVAASHFGF